MEYVKAADFFHYLVFELDFDNKIIDDIFLSDDIILGPEIDGKITINVESFIEVFNKMYGND